MRIYNNLFYKKGAFAPLLLITLPDFPRLPARRRRRIQSRYDRPAADRGAAWRHGGRARRGSSQGQMA